MKALHLATILPRRGKLRGEEARLVERYLLRANRLVPCTNPVFETEELFFAAAERAPGRPAASVILFDSRGTAVSSEEFAQLLGRLRDDGAQRVLLGIGPPDGWTGAARARAGSVVSLGRITLPHELALVVAAEQIYRALTILAGHPYHSGH